MKKYLAIVLAVIATTSTLCGCTSTSSASSHNNYSSTVETEPTTKIDDNKVPYQKFDKELSNAIASYNKLENNNQQLVIDEINDNNLKVLGQYRIFAEDGEIVTAYSYTYHNQKTSIGIFVNNDNRVVALRYVISNSFMNQLLDENYQNYYKNAKLEQVTNKPARWLSALSNSLTFDDSVTLYGNLNDACTKEPVGYGYYGGYVLQLSPGTSDSNWTFTILKGNRNLVDYIIESEKQGNQFLYPVNSQSDQTSSSQSSSKTSSSDYSQTNQSSNTSTVTYTHTALKGAIIVKQDGSTNLSYKCHCDTCGRTDSSTVNTTHGTGRLLSSFYCIDCKQTQNVEIQTTSK